MTASQSRKSARRARWLSTGHGRARSDIKLPPQIVRRFTTFDPPRRSFMSCVTVGRTLDRLELPNHTPQAAALKSP